MALSIELHSSLDNGYTADVNEYCMTTTEEQDPGSTFETLTLEDFDPSYKKMQCELYLIASDDDNYEIIKQKTL